VTMLSNWDIQGSRLRKLTEAADSISDVATLILEATGLPAGVEIADLPHQLRWAATELANCVMRVDRQYRFLIVARFLAERTLEEIASSLDLSRQRVSQLLLRESERVYSGYSTYSHFEEAAVRGESLTDTAPWMRPGWVHGISSMQSAPQRNSAAIIYSNLICASNSEVPQGEESPWRPFVLSGLIPARNLLETQRKPHSGYLLPNWISSIKKRIPKSDELVYWHASARGPVPARGTGVLEPERPEILATLTWADLVHWDSTGPKSAVIMLRNEVDSNQLELRLYAAMMTGRYIPIPIIVVLPSTGKVTELKWSSLDMEELEIDPAKFEQSSSNPEMLGCNNQGEMTPSRVQEIWHVYEANLPGVMALVDSNLRQNNGVGTLFWGRYRPLLDGGTIRLIRI
jgi:hypothetical protein